ncbi:MAG: EAL domain-containing protein [Oscillospiraceae bacterium]|nr:EAL domain-containing protein [Oscillospiraceae bacterium]MDY6209039.1 EAL domain-containing protein [Oscillospiraceae bacterium]
MKVTAEIVREIIEKKDIIVEFQPIYSLNTKKYIGLEALSRGRYKDEIVSPYFLFEYAKKDGTVLTLDRICREKAMRAFSAESSAPSLFINFETSVLNGITSGTGEIQRTAAENHISPQNIVIELNESRVKDSYNLMMFVDFYRSKGFLIALDNVSAGLDTLNRIMLINPDIIKIDRAIVSQIDSNKYNQEVFRSIINTAKQIGAMTVAEGVETVDEVITCMILGVDYFQGFYFQKPEQFNYLFTNEARLRVEEAAQKLNISTKKNPTVVNMMIESYKRIIYELVNRLSCMTHDDYNAELRDYVDEHSEIECAFLIDSKGFQITDTVMTPGVEILEGYHPALMGVNHDIKNYFYAIKEQIEDPFISGWYISNATGKSCKTISSKFYNKKGEMIVACVDLKKQ